MPGWVWAALIAFAVGLAIGAELHAEPVVTLQVRPTIMMKRGDIRIDAHVARDAANRALSIAWTSDVGSEGATIRQLDGADAPLTQTFWLRDQPCAAYAFVAAVFDAAGHRRGTARADIHTPEHDGGSLSPLAHRRSSSVGLSRTLADQSLAVPLPLARYAPPSAPGPFSGVVR